MGIIDQLAELDFHPPHTPGDSFSEIDEQAPGFANKFCEVRVEVIGQLEPQIDVRPLKTSPHWALTEVAEVEHALVNIDAHAYVCASVRYCHMGIPFVMVAASVGAPGLGGLRRYEERTADGWPELIIECHYRALPTMQGLMRRLLVDVASLKLSEVLADLERRAGRQ